jgi:RNA recognition motif-containing protein
MRDGKAFIKFETQEALDNAVLLNGSTLYDTQLFVEQARNNKAPNTKRDPNYNVVFVGGLDYYSTIQQLQDVFNDCGEIKDIRMPMAFDRTRVFF